MLIGSCPHCSYLNSEGEKNLEWLEICIIYSVFFLVYYLFVGTEYRTKNKDMEHHPLLSHRE